MLDDLGAGHNSLNLPLTEIKPDFIKLDMHLMRNIDRDPYKSRVASKVLELAQGTPDPHGGSKGRDARPMAMGSDHGALRPRLLFAKPAPNPRPVALPPGNGSGVCQNSQDLVGST